MSKVEVLYDEWTNRGRLLQTKRVWIEPNSGHAVTIYTDDCINSRSTYGDKMNAYNRTMYRCECGRLETSLRRPSKKLLATHNSWWTKEQSDSLLAAIGVEAQ